MHRAVLALAIVLAAAAPSFAAAKAKGHVAKAKVHHVAKPKAAKAVQDPNANTAKLFANMFK